MQTIDFIRISKLITMTSISYLYKGASSKTCVHTMKLWMRMRIKVVWSKDLPIQTPQVYLHPMTPSIFLKLMLL